ncbi:MAG: hypothetical protein QW515_05670, partial [Thermoplasmatales archaeon]
MRISITVFTGKTIWFPSKDKVLRNFFTPNGIILVKRQMPFTTGTRSPFFPLIYPFVAKPVVFHSLGIRFPTIFANFFAEYCISDEVRV